MVDFSEVTVRHALLKFGLQGLGLNLGMVEHLMAGPFPGNSKFVSARIYVILANHIASVYPGQVLPPTNLRNPIE